MDAHAWLSHVTSTKIKYTGSLSNSTSPDGKSSNSLSGSTLLDHFFIKEFLSRNVPFKE